MECPDKCSMKLEELEGHQDNHHVSLYGKPDGDGGVVGKQKALKECIKKFITRKGMGYAIGASVIGTLAIVVTITLYSHAAHSNDKRIMQEATQINSMKIQKGESAHEANVTQLSNNTERLKRIETDIGTIKANMIQPEQLSEIITKAVKEGIKP